MKRWCKLDKRASFFILWEEVSDVGIAIASSSVQSDPANNGKHIQLGSEVGYVLSDSPNSKSLMIQLSKIKINLKRVKKTYEQ